MDSRKKIILVTPSRLLAKGLESMLDGVGDLCISAVLTDLSKSSLIYMRSLGADMVVVDPLVLDYQSRMNIRGLIAAQVDVAVVAFNTMSADSDSAKQFDEIISIYDESAVIIKKLRSAVSTHVGSVAVDESELSQREKEILVCVAKGMQNKEIASLCNLSVHTVISHRKNISRKTGIKTVAGLTVYALLNNLIDSSAIDL